jgi:hypothetical protein
MNTLMGPENTTGSPINKIIETQMSIFNESKIDTPPVTKPINTTQPPQLEMTTINFTINEKVSTLSSSKKHIIGVIGQTGKFYKMEISLFAEDQNWGNFCSNYTVGIMRDNVWLAYKQMQPMRPGSKEKFIIDATSDNIKLDKDDQVVIELNAPFGGCSVILTDISINVYITNPQIEKFTNTSNNSKHNQISLLILLFIIIIIIVLLLNCNK